jgi:hypothetical protein
VTHASDDPGAPDMGDLIVVLLASSLAALRDRLAEDGFNPAALLVADLVDIADEYITNCIPCTDNRTSSADQGWNRWNPTKSD